MIELRFAGAWKNKNYAIANGRNTIFALDRILILFYNFANNNLHKRMCVYGDWLWHMQSVCLSAFSINLFIHNYLQAINFGHSFCLTSIRNSVLHLGFS